MEPCSRQLDFMQWRSRMASELTDSETPRAIDGFSLTSQYPPSLRKTVLLVRLVNCYVALYQQA